MRKSRVLLAGVAVAAAAVATSAFTASNTGPDQRRRVTARRRHRRHVTNIHYAPWRRTTSADAVVFTTTTDVPRRDGDPDPQGRTGHTVGGTYAAPGHVRLAKYATSRATRPPRHRRLTRTSTPSASSVGAVTTCLGAGGAARRPPRPDPGGASHDSAPRAASISASPRWCWRLPGCSGPRGWAAARPTCPRTASACSRASTPGTWRSCGRRTGTGWVTSSPTAALAENGRHAPDRRHGRRPASSSRATTTTGWTRTTRPSDQVLGKLWLRIPQGGQALAALHSPAALALLAASGPAPRARRRRHPRRPSAGRRLRPPRPRLSASDPGPRRARCARSPAAVAVVAGVGGGVLLALPSTQTDAPPSR